MLINVNMSNPYSVRCGMWFQRVEEVVDIEAIPANPLNKNDISQRIKAFQKKQIRTGGDSVPDEDEDIRLYKRVRLLQKKYRDKPEPPEIYPGLERSPESTHVRSKTTLTTEQRRLDSHKTSRDWTPSDLPAGLEKPEEKEEENKSKVLSTDFKLGDVDDRILCWLSHKLRLSGLEVELLRRLTDGLDSSAAPEKWQEQVLKFWVCDPANLLAPACEIEPTLTAFPRSPFKDPKKISYDFIDLQPVQLAIRNRASSQKLDFGMRLKLIRMKGKSAMTV